MCCSKDEAVPSNYTRFIQLIEKRVEMTVFLCTAMNSGVNVSPLVSRRSVIFIVKSSHCFLTLQSLPGN